MGDNRQRFVGALLPLAEGDASLSMPGRAACDYVFTLYSGLNALAKSGATREELRAVAAAGLQVFA